MEDKYYKLTLFACPNPGEYWMRPDVFARVGDGVHWKSCGE